MLLRTALAFLVLALVAGLLGFAGSATSWTSFAQTLFFGFMCGFLVMLMMGLATERGRAA